MIDGSSTAFLADFGQCCVLEGPFHPMFASTELYARLTRFLIR